MNSRPMLITCVCLTTISSAWGQNAKPDTSLFDQKVVRLVHTDAKDTARMLQSFLTEGKAAWDERTNAIVISAPAAEIEMALGVIKELDTPRDDVEGQTSAIIAAGENPPPELMNLIQTLLSDNTRAAIDQRTGMIALRGSNADIAEVQKLIDALPRRNVQTGSRPLGISFFFIQGLMGPENQPAAPPVERRALHTPDPRDAAVKQKLEHMVGINVDRTPFADVLAQLANAAETDIVVNWPDLEAHGIGRDDLVTVQLRDQVPLRQALALAFEQLGEINITYAVQQGILRIATDAALNRDTYLEVYDVHELVKAVPRYALGTLATNSTPAAGRGGLGGGADAGGRAGAQNPFSGTSTDDPRATTPYVAPIMWEESDEEYADNLMELIRQTITPDDWAENGGSVATIDESSGMLVVKHNARGHEAIGNLLNLMRERHAATRAAVSRVPMPAMLAPVMETLTESGFRNAVLLAPLKVAVGRNGIFEIEGSAAQFDRMLGVKVKGEASLTEANVVELRVHAEIGPKVALPGTLGGPEPMFRLSSTVTTALGDYVVLATSPGATDYGQAVALVVRVDAPQ